MRPIAALVGLTIKTPQIETMTRFYADAFGLTVQSHDDHAVNLGGTVGPSAQLTLRRAAQRGLEGLTFAMRSRENVDASAAELQAAGITLAAEPAVRGDDYDFAIKDPDGFILRFKVADVPTPHGHDGTDRPLFLSHVVLNTRDATRLVDFYTTILGFTTSDAYEKGLLTFLRCDQPQHHCIGISPGPVDGLNHFAMDCGNIDAVMRSISRMHSLNHEPIWGPGRHGPGGNIFCYYEDPDGFVPELTCDVLQITDERAWQPRIWERIPANANVWNSGGPTQRAIELMSGTGQLL